MHDLIRGLSPIPLAVTTLPDGKRVKVIASTVADADTPHAEPGVILAVSTEGEGWLELACAGGSIRVHRLLPEGKSRMTAADFLRGRRAAVGDVWGK